MNTDDFHTRYAEELGQIGAGSLERVDRPLRERVEAARRRLVQQWHDDAGKLLTAAGVPEWVEVGGMPGNSLPHRLEWFLLRRKDVSAAERSGVLTELNAMKWPIVKLCEEGGK